MTEQPRLLVGTRKGSFVYTADDDRQTWTVSAPMNPGWQVYSMTADTRGDRLRLYAACNHDVWGPSVAKSEDGGGTWDRRSQGLGFTPASGESILAVWKVQPGHDSQPGVVYAGVAPAGLFRSEDWGVNWEPVRGINEHEFRAMFQPIPGGGAPVHSIEIDPRDPDHVYVAISGGGSYVTLDGGGSWRLFSHHAIAQTEEARAFVSQNLANVPPDIDPAAVFDMHSMRLDRKRPDRLWTQAHTGVFRSDDGGRSWDDVTPGLPSFHGFPVAVTKRDPDAAYIVPLDVGTDNFRVAPGQFAVYRTRDGGSTWDALTQGLPGPSDYQSVYREGLDTDGLEPEGVYVGTSNGQLYASLDGGDSWKRLPGTLPPILSVSCAVF